MHLESFQNQRALPIRRLAFSQVDGRQILVLNPFWKNVFYLTIMNQEECRIEIMKSVGILGKNVQL